MESQPTAEEKQLLVSSFLEIAAGQSADIAAQFLQATSWKLDEAIHLFYIENEGGRLPSSSMPPPVINENPSVNESLPIDPGEEEVRAPLPVKRETLYGDAPAISMQPHQVMPFRDFEQESRQQSAVWNQDRNAESTANNSPRDNLASLYRPPFALMFNGPFDKAKVEAALQEKWLLINLQSTEEFSSHMLNRDTWANEALAQTIRTNFIFWQVYHDTSEGRKVCTYYNLLSIPAILVIDPITGQKMRAWSGMVQPDRLLEDLLPYLDKGPKEHHAILPHKRPRELACDPAPSIPEKSAAAVVDDEDEEVRRAIAASLEDVKGPHGAGPTDADVEEKQDADVAGAAGSNGNAEYEYPPLPEEPKATRDLLCRVGIRLPDGRRLQRSFLKSDSVKLLWSFCCTQVEDGERRPFHFTQAIPGAPPKNLEFESDQTFEEAGLSNSMVNLLLD